MEGHVKSIDKVKMEIIDAASDGDLLSDWCVENLPLDFFVDSTDAIEAYAQLSQWVISDKHDYTPRAKEKFLAANYADAWLTAISIHDKKFAIVTE